MTYGTVVVILGFSYVFVAFLMLRLNYMINRLDNQTSLIYKLQMIWALNWGKDPEAIRAILEGVINGKRKDNDSESSGIR